MQKLIPAFLTLALIQCSFGEKEYSGPVWVDGERHDILFSYDIEEKRVSPIVVMKWNPEAFYASLAYHPEEKTYYIFSYGKRVLVCESGLYLLNEDKIETIDGSFTLDPDQAERFKVDSHFRDQIITEAFKKKEKLA